MARFSLVLLAVSLAVGLFAFPPPTARGDEAAKKAEPEKKPDILSPRYDLTIWTIVVFALLLLVLRRWAWGPMLEGLRNRETNIRKALEDAEQAKRETAELRRTLQAEMDKANDKVRAMIEEGRRDAQRTVDEMMAKARADIQAERDRLRRELDMARDQAIKELWEQTALLATQVSSRVVRRQLNVDDHRRIVDETLAELRHAASDKVRAN
jgi:F-type H+-transporting ATPase subunit b